MKQIRPTPEEFMEVTAHLFEEAREMPHFNSTATFPDKRGNPCRYIHDIMDEAYIVRPRVEKAIPGTLPREEHMTRVLWNAVLRSHNLLRTFLPFGWITEFTTFVQYIQLASKTKTMLRDFLAKDPAHRAAFKRICSTLPLPEQERSLQRFMPTRQEFNHG